MTGRAGMALALFVALLLALLGLPSRAYAEPDYTEAIAATQDGFNAAKDTAKDTKEKLEKALETYKNIKEYVSGSTGTELIDRLYQSRGIEDHTRITELRGKLQEVLRRLDQAGIESKLEHATKILGQFEEIAGGASDAVAFMERFNPEGARGDPTRGLRIIGGAIEDAAGSLPWPMDEIFKEYARATTTFSNRLNDLHKKINENTRQGSLGGSYAGYAEAQEFFEKNFEGRDGRTSTTFLDVSGQFPLLGKAVQVFHDVGSQAGEYYVYSIDDARGFIVPIAFETAYRYFAALPDVTAVPPDRRVAVLIARASSGTLQDQVTEAVRIRALFESARADKEPLLRALNLWDTLGVLLLYGGDAFVGFFLYIPERHAEIERVRAALEEHVFITGNVTDADGKPAPNIPLKLDVAGKGSGNAATNESGGYVVVARGGPGDAFELRAGQEGAAQPKRGSFDDRRMFRGMDFQLGSELSPVRVFVVDQESQDPIEGASVTLGALGERPAPPSGAVFLLPAGNYTGTASAPEHKGRGFSVTVAPPEGVRAAVANVWDDLPGVVQGALRWAGSVAPFLSAEVAVEVSLEGKGEKGDAGADAGDGGDAGDADDGKFRVVLSAPKTTLDLGEKVTVLATPVHGVPPISYAWSIDGLAMPSRDVPTLPITFGKLGHHFIGVTATDSSSPPAETASNLDIIVGVANDPDLVGRWEGMSRVLEFKSDMAEVDTNAQGASGPAALWIAPDGSGGLKVVPMGGQGYFCHPAEVASRKGNQLRMSYDGLSPLPQNAYWKITAACTMDLALAEGRLKGSVLVTSSATISVPNNPPTTSSSRAKYAFDLRKASPNPGPPPKPAGPKPPSP